MALAFDAASSSSTAVGPTLTWSHTCSGAQRVLVVGVGLETAQSVTSVTYGGVELTRVGYVAQGQGDTYDDVRSELWVLIAPLTGANNIVVTASGETEIIGGATSWTGAHQSAPTGVFASATGTSNAPSVAVASTAGDFVVDNMIASRSSPGTITATVGAGQTQRWNQVIGVSYPKRACGSTEGGAASVTMSWTLSASFPWAICGVCIKVYAAPPATTATELWLIPARIEPFTIEENYTGELARALSSIYPHLLAWKVVNGRFIWHDLGWLPAQAPIDAMALADVPLGSGVDPGLTLFGVESHDSVVLTSLGSSALGAGQRRFPDPGGVAGTDSGVLYASRMEFPQPHKLLQVRIWGEDFQQADTVRFAYRWDRRRWYSIGEIHGLPATATVQDEEGGMFLEYVVGFTDKYAWEPSLPVITRIDAQVEPLAEGAARPEADVQIPEQE